MIDNFNSLSNIQYTDLSTVVTISAFAAAMFEPMMAAGKNQGVTDTTVTVYDV